MPSLRHCRAPRKPARPIEYILAGIADSRGFIEEEKAKRVLHESGLVLAPGSTYDKVFDSLREQGKIEYRGGHIYIPESTRIESRRQKPIR